MDRVAAAIITVWDANNLDNTFPGGVSTEWGSHEGGPGPQGSVTYPYVILDFQPKFVDNWSSGYQWSVLPVDFLIFDKEDGSTDPFAAVGTLVRALEAVFDFAALSITGSTLYQMRPTGQNIQAYDDEQAIWLGTVSYEIRAYKATIGCS
jgi:hypothetical protein